MLKISLEGIQCIQAKEGTWIISDYVIKRKKKTLMLWDNDAEILETISHGKNKEIIS